MSVQKPKDALDTVGTILTEDHGRDAVHVAVFQSCSRKRVRPGEWVGLVNEGDPSEVTPYAVKVVGIVDPFVRHDQIEPGERFWVFVKPGTITGLRHSWTHPALPEETK